MAGSKDAGSPAQNDALRTPSPDAHMQQHEAYETKIARAAGSRLTIRRQALAPSTENDTITVIGNESATSRRQQSREAMDDPSQLAVAHQLLRADPLEQQSDQRRTQV